MSAIKYEIQGDATAHLAEALGKIDAAVIHQRPEVLLWLHEGAALAQRLALAEEEVRETQALLSAATVRAERAEAFKAYTHERLDKFGVPTHPDGPHGAAGCRIGDRLDYLFGALDRMFAGIKAVNEDPNVSDVASVRSAMLQVRSHALGAALAGVASPGPAVPDHTPAEVVRHLPELLDIARGKVYGPPQALEVREVPELAASTQEYAWRRFHVTFDPNRPFPAVGAESGIPRVGDEHPDPALEQKGCSLACIEVKEAPHAVAAPALGRVCVEAVYRYRPIPVM